MPAVKSRREQYSDATRAALLETATALFGERGFADTSLDDVARATRVTRGAVYHHFANKQALFEAVMTDLGQEMLGRVAAAAGWRPDTWAAAAAALGAYLDHCCDPVYGRICWQEAPVALGYARWMECEKEYAFGLTATFARVMTDAGLIDPGPMDTAVSLMFWLIGGAGQTIAEAPEADRARVRDECERQILRMVNGLRPPEPDGRITPFPTA